MREIGYNHEVAVEVKEASYRYECVAVFQIVNKKTDTDKLSEYIHNELSKLENQSNGYMQDESRWLFEVTKKLKVTIKWTMECCTKSANPIQDVLNRVFSLIHGSCECRILSLTADVEKVSETFSACVRPTYESWR
ncbi:MAG: hypothetical protein WC444_04155 [Candidatus Paceibacterota bacterium]